MAPAPLKSPRPRAVDPALAGNLTEIALIAFEAGASVVYLIREPEKMYLRDDHGQPLVVASAATALLLLFPCRTEGEPSLVAWRAEDVRPLLG